MSTGRMFEKIGGLYTSLFGAGMIWKLLFQRNMYKGEVIQKVYYTEKHKSKTNSKVENAEDSMTDEENNDEDIQRAKKQILSRTRFKYGFLENLFGYLTFSFCIVYC